LNPSQRRRSQSATNRHKTKVVEEPRGAPRRGVSNRLQQPVISSAEYSETSTMPKPEFLCGNLRRFAAPADRFRNNSAENFAYCRYFPVKLCGLGKVCRIGAVCLLFHKFAK
jgi:hypothetical protein